MLVLESCLGIRHTRSLPFSFGAIRVNLDSALAQNAFIKSCTQVKYQLSRHSRKSYSEITEV